MWQMEWTGLRVSQTTPLDLLERRTDATKGRTTKAYRGDVSTRLRQIWELDHCVVQFLTVHGNLSAKLNGLQLVDSPESGWCDVDETVEHVLWKCRRLEEERRVLLCEDAVEDGRLGCWLEIADRK